jgi:hypothetical protein
MKLILSGIGLVDEKAKTKLGTKLPIKKSVTDIQ